MTIYEAMKEAGVPIEHHETDLYVPVTPVTRAIISNYEHKKIVSTFVSEGRFWFDIPFAYTPAWKK